MGTVGRMLSDGPHVVEGAPGIKGDGCLAGLLRYAAKVINSSCYFRSRFISSYRFVTPIIPNKVKKDQYALRFAHE